MQTQLSTTIALYGALKHLVDTARASGQPLNEWAALPFSMADEAILAFEREITELNAKGA